MSDAVLALPREEGALLSLCFCGGLASMFDILQLLTRKEVNLWAKKGPFVVLDKAYLIISTTEPIHLCREKLMGVWLFFGGTWLNFKTADRHRVLIYWGLGGGFTCNPYLPAMLCKVVFFFFFFLQNIKLHLPSHMKEGTQLPKGRNEAFQL